MRLGTGAAPVALGTGVLVLLGGAPAGAAVAGAPDTRIGGPAIHDEVFQVRPLTFSGTATDDTGVATVWVAVQDRRTRRWYRPDGTFGPFFRFPAKLATPGGRKTAWTFTWKPPVPGHYTLQANAMDAAGNPDSELPWRRFFVDRHAPDTKINGPKAWTVDRRRGQSVIFTGRASDDYGVRHLEVAVQNRRTGKWLRPQGKWGKIYWHHRKVRQPGAPMPTWTFTQRFNWTGTFLVRVRAVDLAGRVDGSHSTKQVKVSR